MAFNSVIDNEKYVDLIYDSDKKTEIKDYINQWYSKVILSNPGLDNEVIVGNFCSDTTGIGVLPKYYGGWNKNLPESWKIVDNDSKISNINPTLKCNYDKNLNYGGLIKTKVGLIR